MQDVQNIPAPDSDSNDPNEGLGSHSNVREDLDNEDAEPINEIDEETEPQSIPTGFEQRPRDESERTDIEQP